MTDSPLREGTGKLCIGEMLYAGIQSHFLLFHCLSMLC
jgi:hypothetical protein